MLKTAGAKKGTGLDELLRTFQTTQPEEKVKLKPQPSHRIDLLLQMYHRYLEDDKYYHQGGEGFKSEALEYLSAAPNPVEINAFVQASMKFEKHRRNYSVFAPFVTRLIQNSYDQGHNNFVITNDLPDILWHFFGGDLHGIEDRPLHLKIDGDLWDNFCELATYVNARLDGNIRGGFGKQSQYSSFEITGSATSCAEHARNSIFTFNTIREFDYAPEEEPVECTFRTPNEQMIPELLGDLPTGNRIVYIQKDGTERIVRDYDD